MLDGTPGSTVSEQRHNGSPRGVGLRPVTRAFRQRRHETVSRTEAPSLSHRELLQRDAASLRNYASLSPPPCRPSRRFDTPWHEPVDRPRITDWPAIPLACKPHTRPAAAGSLIV